MKKAVTIPTCDTLVQYMCGKDVVTTKKCLLILGYAKTTPVIIVENCSLVNERIFILQLSTSVHSLTQCTGGPVLVMIGNALTI